MVYQQTEIQVFSLCDHSEWNRCLCMMTNSVREKLKWRLNISKKIIVNGIKAVTFDKKNNLTKNNCYF